MSASTTIDTDDTATAPPRPAAAPRDRVVLTVSSGSHAGAEAALGLGSYVIGRAGHCDVVLRDDGVADEHLLLNVSADGALLRALAGGVRRGGVRVRPNARFALDAGKGESLPIELGPVRLRLRYGNPHDDAGGSGAEASTDQQPAGAAARWPMRALDVARRRPVASFLLGALLVSGTLGLAVSAVRDGGLAAWGDSAAAQLEQARLKVEGLGGLGEVKVSVSAAGETLLSGYVPDSNALRRVRQAFGPADGVRLSLFPADELVRFAREWLAAHDYRVAVAYAGGGRVAIGGGDTGKPGFEQAASRLMQEIPGLAGVETTITPLPGVPASRPAPRKPDDPYVLSGVNAVNAGHPVPYMTAGATYIFPGGALKNGMTVLEIESDRVKVDDHGVTSAQEVRIR